MTPNTTTRKLTQLCLYNRTAKNYDCTTMSVQMKCTQVYLAHFYFAISVPFGFGAIVVVDIVVVVVHALDAVVFFYFYSAQNATANYRVFLKHSMPKVNDDKIQSVIASHVYVCVPHTVRKLVTFNCHRPPSCITHMCLCHNNVTVFLFIALQRNRK